MSLMEFEIPGKHLECINTKKLWNAYMKEFIKKIKN